MITKAEAISLWLHWVWSWDQCVCYFENYVHSAFYDIEGEVLTKEEAFTRWQSEGYSRGACESFFREHAQRSRKQASRSASPGLEAFVENVTEWHTKAGDS